MWCAIPKLSYGVHGSLAGSVLLPYPVCVFQAGGAEAGPANPLSRDEAGSAHTD